MELDELRVLVLDDEPAALTASAEKIALYLPEENILRASSAVELIRLLGAGSVDLAFLDVEMPDTDGFSAAEYIRSAHPETKVVFLTGHTELGARSYDYEAFDFLSKPLDVMRLKRTFDRYLALRAPERRSNRRVAVETTQGYALLSPADIRYIAREGRKSVIHCQEETYTLWSPLDTLEAAFEEFDFFRCHQSYLVPLGQIASVVQADFGRTYWLVLSGGERLPVSRKRYALLRRRLEESGIQFL